MLRCDLDSLLTKLNVRLEAVAVCNISEGVTLAFDAFEGTVVHHVVRGHGILETPGSPSLSFSPGSMMLVPRGLTKRVTAGCLPSMPVHARDHCSSEPNKLMRLTAINGDGAADAVIVCGTIHATCGSFGPFDALTTPLVEDMSGIGAVRIAFEAMLAEQTHPAIVSGALTQVLMKQCLLFFIRQHLLAHELSPLSAALRDERLARALNSILENPHALLRVKDLAIVAGMSRSSFAKLFVETLNTTPVEFARRSRLQKAADLLASTDLPIKRIAGQVGYESRSQFCRAFRAALGMHPSEYRGRVRTR